MTKKILAALLAVFLLAQPVLADGIFNDGTLDWGTCTHVYDNACDTKCNSCGVQRTVPPHPYTGVVTTPATCAAEGVMTYTCTVCGDRYTAAIPTVGHTYTDACDADCNGCGATRTPPHQYADPYDADCDLCGTTREVKPMTIGDVNGDGNVNVRDLGLLQQHLNGWDVSISLEAANVNGVSGVNVRDYGLLQQYLNGWDVKLG